jgi:hypothetical protein
MSKKQSKKQPLHQNYHNLKLIFAWIVHSLLRYNYKKHKYQIMWHINLYWLVQHYWKSKFVLQSKIPSTQINENWSRWKLERLYPASCRGSKFRQTILAILTRIRDKNRTTPLSPCRMHRTNCCARDSLSLYLQNHKNPVRAWGNPNLS